MLFRPIRTTTIIFSCVCALPIVLLFALWRFQEQLIFMPNIGEYVYATPDAPGYRDPGEWDIPYEDVWIDADSGHKVHGWLLKQPDSKTRPTIVFFHGNAGSIKRRLPFYSQLYEMLKVNVFASSYRGYGQSTGEPSEQAISADNQILIEKLRNHGDLHPERIFVFGVSLGGAAAVDLAYKKPNAVRGVIVENTFWDLQSVAREVYKPLKYVTFLDKILRHKFESGKKIGQLKQPIMFISADSDELIPPAHMRRLHETAINSCSRWWVSIGGGTHNGSWTVHPRAYYKAIREFLKNVLSDDISGDRTILVGEPAKPVQHGPADDQPSDSAFLTKIMTMIRGEEAAAAASTDKKEL